MDQNCTLEPARGLSPKPDLSEISSTRYFPMVLRHTLEIDRCGLALNNQMESDVFHICSDDGVSKVSWHYFIYRLLSKHLVMIKVVIDSCSAPMYASVELRINTHKPIANSLNMHKLIAYRIDGYTEAGSTLGEIEVSRESFLYLLDNKIDCTLWLNADYGPLKQPEFQVPKDFASLLSNEQLADVTIMVGQRKFYAQRAILSVRSVVFAAMFQSGMQESTQNHIIIENLEPDVFQEVLRFINTGKVKGLDRMARDLLGAAEKYALGDLKKMCEDQLHGDILKETVLQTLALADLYHAQELRDRAIRFIRANIKSVPTEELVMFCKKNPVLAANVWQEKFN